MATNIGPKIGIDGEAEYRKQINNIIQQAKTLDSEMRAVTSSFTKSTSAEEKSAATSKILAQQVEVQKQRVQELSSMLEKSAQKYGENDTRTLKWKEAVNKATAELNKMENELSDAADSTDDLGDAMDDAGDNALTFGDVLKANVLSQAIVAGVQALADGIKKVSGALKEAVVAGAAFADNILTLSTNTGLSTDELQEYQYMAELTDTSLDTITGSLTRLIRNMSTAAKGTGTAANAFKALGIEVTDQNGELRNSQDVFAETIDALGSMENETQRDAYAMAIFGKSAQELNSFIAQGPDGIAALAQEAHDMSYVLDNETLKSLGGVDDAMQRMKNLTTSVKNNIAAGLAPVVEDIAQKMIQWAQSVDWKDVGIKTGKVLLNIKTFAAFIADNGPAIISVIAGIAAGFVAWNVASMIMGVIGAIKGVVTALQAGKTATEALNIAMSANPIVLITTLIAGLVAALVTLWNTNEDFRNSVIEIGQEIKEFVGGIVDAIVNFFTVTLPGAFQKLWEDTKNIVNNIKQAFLNMRDKIAETVGNVKNAIIDGIGKAVEWITSLPGQAIQWGKDMIQGFIDGIKSMIGKIGDAISGVANKIASFLHFSRPDVGPLRNYETWMPDMISGMAAGLKANAHLLADAASDAAGNIAYSMPGASTTNYGGINIQVYGADGQNVNELADIVMSRIESAVNRKEAVW